MKNSCLFLLTYLMIGRIFSSDTKKESTTVACDLSEEIEKYDFLKIKKDQLKQEIKDIIGSINALDKNEFCDSYNLEKNRLLEELSPLTDEIKNVDREFYASNRRIKKLCKIQENSLINTKSYNDNAENEPFENTKSTKNVSQEKVDNFIEENEAKEAQKQNENGLKKDSITGDLSKND